MESQSLDDVAGHEKGCLVPCSRLVPLQGEGRMRNGAK